jgi:protein-disulfide isomerase
MPRLRIVTLAAGLGLWAAAAVAAAGRGLGVKGTPTVLIGRVRFSGALDADTIDSLIRSAFELAK